MGPECLQLFYSGHITSNPTDVSNVQRSTRACSTRCTVTEFKIHLDGLGQGTEGLFLVPSLFHCRRTVYHAVQAVYEAEGG